MELKVTSTFNSFYGGANMAEHIVCQQDERIRLMSKQVDRLEVNSDNYKQDMSEVKGIISKVLWGLVGTMGMAIVNLLVLLWDKR